PSARRAGSPPPGPASSASGWRARPSSLLRFLVRLVLIAPRAVFLPLRPFRVLAPVLGREIVPAFAHGAFHDDVFPRHLSFSVVRHPLSVVHYGQRTTDDVLLQDFGCDSRADGAAAFADRKPQLLLHRDRRDQLDRHLRVVPRHHHLHPRRQLHRPRHIRRPQVKLRPIPLEEGGMPPAFLFGQDVHFALELRVRRDAPRLRQHHPPLHLVLLHPPQQQPHVVPRLPLIQQLAEHLHPRHHHLLVRPKPHHLHFLVHLHLSPLDPARRHRPPARDRKHVLHRHQERLLDLPLRDRNVLVQRREQLLHLAHPRLVPGDRLQGRPPDDRDVVPRVLVLAQELPHLQ